MSLLDFFVIGRPPVPDAVQAEGVQAVLQDSEALAVGEHWLEADDALVVSFYHALAVFVDFRRALTLDVASHAVLKSLRPHRLRMRILAAISIFAISLQKPLTGCPICVIF